MLTLRFVCRYAVLLLVAIVIVCCALFLQYIYNENDFQKKIYLTRKIQNIQYTDTQQDCRFHSCFDVFRCQPDQKGHLKIFVYTDIKFTDSNKRKIFPETSYEFELLVEHFRRNKHVTKNASEACLLFPAVDILSEEGLNLNLVSTAFHSLSKWDKGSNHLIFNFFPKLPLHFTSQVNFQTGKAMIASPNFVNSNFRQGFDVSIPLFNSLTVLDPKTHRISYSAERQWKVIISQLAINKQHRDVLRKVEDKHGDVFMLRKCLGEKSKHMYHEKLCKDGLPFNYPSLLKDGEFCLILRGLYYASTLLLDAMMLGCIPVIAMDDYVMPFDDVIDWSRASVRLREYQLNELVEILGRIDEDEIHMRRYQAFQLWKKYFSSLEKIADTLLDVYRERVFITSKKSYEDWNGRIGTLSDEEMRPGPLSPLFLPLKPTSQDGFTAVVLTYNRFDMLLMLINQLVKVQSLVKIIVVWNNPYSDPHANQWPDIEKPWKLIRTKTNRLTNRFYPFEEIETEAVMAIDDDILMLTTDEIEFAYQTWKEFPDRLVGFPARVHLLHPKELINGKRLLFKYESEWMNSVSMVLTGAAFYHQIYNHWFTYMLPLKTRSYIDEKMNCEDIGMNFLISNLTGKAPIKVTPRKRFKCAQCRSNDSLWSESSHFIKRSECLSVFTQHFGRMPLRPVEFRADPVLFQESVPQDLLAYPDVGMV